MKSGSALVIGAGIGGLAAAVALHRSGWKVTVLEQASLTAGVDAGISQGPNAMRALDELGVGPAARAASTPFFGAMNLREPSGRYCNHVASGAVPSLWGIHHADLCALLADALPASALRTGTCARSIIQDLGRVVVDIGDKRLDADLVVAADGAHSTTRSRLWLSAPEPRFWHSTMWRGIADLDLDPADSGITMARDRYFLTMPLSRGRVYWTLGVRAESRGAWGTEKHAVVSRLTDGWHDPIPQLLAATPASRILHHDITDLNHAPLKTFVNRRIALLGDAAHPMSNELGLGAGQALEDAVVLAHSLTDAGGVTEGLRRYDANRRPRAQSVARTAHRTGVRYISGNTLRHMVKIWGIRVLPAAVLPRITDWTLRRIWGWQPPTGSHRLTELWAWSPGLPW